MTSGNMRVLIINRQLGFSVRIKQALEQMGGFEVAPFTAPDAALEYLQGNRQDVALVDFTIPGVSGSDLVYTMRQIQPGLPIIASPDVPDVVTEVRSLKVNGIVDVPIGARELKPVLEEAVRQSAVGLSTDTQESPAFLDDDTASMETVGDAPEFDSFDNKINKPGGLADDMDADEIADVEGSESGTIEFVIKDDVSALQEQFEQEEPSDTVDEEAERAVDVFQKLAEEEPPMPTLEDTGTVGDLKTGVTSANLYELAEALMDEQSRQEASALDETAGDADEPDSAMIRSILESASSPDAPKPSLDELLSNIERQFPEDASGVRPLPSWVRDVDRYVREPDFLDEALPEIEDEPSSATTTMIDDEDVDEVAWSDADLVEESSPEESQTPFDAAVDIDDSMVEEDDTGAQFEETSEEPWARYGADLVGESYPESSQIPLDVADDIEDGMVEEDDTGIQFEETSEEPWARYEVESAEYQFVSDDDDESEEVVYQDEPEPVADTFPAAQETELDQDEADSALELESQTIEPEEDEVVYETAPQATLDDIAPEEFDDDDEDMEPRRIPTDDPELAQMALSLTQASLESTAAAILLAKDKEVVAYSGDLPLDEVAKLHDTVAGDWDANPGEARVRFATLPDTGLDYMLYSRRTEGDFTLSLIFEGTLPLRIIRQQSDKILDALTAVPENEEEQIAEEHAVVNELYELEEVAAQEEDAALESTQELLRQQGETEVKSDLALAADLAIKAASQPVEMVRYTYLWMLRDPSRSLTREAAQALVVRLDEWLTSLGWKVEILQVYEDYVYLMADVPDDQPVQDLIFELKEFSAKIVAQFEAVDDIYTLWADSYGFLTPGRQLTQEEVQEFINFERA